MPNLKTIKKILDVGLVPVVRATSADEAGTPHAQRYHTALQEHPDAVFAHRDVANVLKTRAR